VVYQGIASLATRQEIEQLKKMAKALPPSENFDNAGILYGKVAELSEYEDVEQLKILAKELSSSGNRPSAGIIYEKVVSLSREENIEELETIAKTLWTSRDIENAAVIRKGITVILDRAENIPNQRKSEAQLRYGFILMELKNYNPAEEALRAVISYEPNKFDPYYYLCLLYKDSAKSNANEGIQFCNQALRLDPGVAPEKRARLWYERGLLLDKEGMPVQVLFFAS
jgi:tetratricopeptide (TPR) repeat protein